MKCTLMNKNTPVLVADYDAELLGFSEIFKVVDIKYAPLIVEKAYGTDNFRGALSNWFRNRGIPEWRDKLDILLARLGVNSPSELLDKSFGLSLSDQYWLKPAGSELSYADINFFQHDFDSADFLEASFSDNGSQQHSPDSLKTPNNTTDGMLRKCWVIEDGRRFLLKGGYRGDNLQPFNEVLASEICRRLSFKHIDYTLDSYNGKIVSKCECYTDINTEIIPAYQIMIGHEREAAEDNYNIYIRLLEERGITDAREKLENTFILDYIIMNEDRHLNNFSVVRDVNTLEWREVMPIFDSGQALAVDDADATVSGMGRFFYDVLDFDEILKIVNVRDTSRIDFSRLDGIDDYFRDLLLRHQAESGMSERRIELLSSLLKTRVRKIQEIVC